MSIIDDLASIFGPGSVVVFDDAETGPRPAYKQHLDRCHIAEAVKADGRRPSCHRNHDWTDDGRAFHYRYV
jgi:predicted O-methyltransferase YrrM